MTTSIKTKAHKTTAHTNHEETTMHPKTTTKAHKTTAHTNDEETTMNASATTTTAAIESTTPATTAASATATTATASAVAPTSAGLTALVTSLSAALDDAETTLGTAAPSVTATQKKRTAKPRKGSDKVLLQLAPIVEQYQLNSQSLNTTAMLAQHTTAQTLLPLQARLQKVSKRVDDAVFNAQTGSWEMGLQFYGLLQRRAKTDGAVAASVAPLKKVFAYRHPEVQKTTKETTRVNAKLKKTLAIAQKHGVTVAVAPDGGVQVVKGEPGAVSAAQAELAAQGVVVGSAVGAGVSGGSAAGTGVTGGSAAAASAPTGATAGAVETPAVAPVAPVGSGH